MRFLFINPGESRHGSTYRARGLCRLLRHRGHDVVYVESNHGDGQGVVSIEQADSISGYIRGTLRRCALSLTSNYDILYLQKAWPLTVGCMVIAKVRRKRVFVDMDDLDSDWQTKVLRRCLMRWTERWMPKCVDRVTTHNRYLQHYLESTARCRPVIIPQGIDTAVFDPRHYDKEREKKKLGLDGCRVLCFLGSFTVGSSGDLHVILEAMKEVEARRGDTCLLIIGGGGPLEGAYRDLIRDLGLKHVRITGRMPQGEVPRHLAACDMGLVFMEENRANTMRMSLKLIEYLSMELPVVGHTTGESDDVFGRYCVLCDPSPRALAERVVEVLEGGNPRESARDFIVRHYDWEAIGTSQDAMVRHMAP